MCSLFHSRKGRDKRNKKNKFGRQTNGETDTTAMKKKTAQFSAAGAEARRVHPLHLLGCVSCFFLSFFPCWLVLAKVAQGKNILSSFTKEKNKKKSKFVKKKSRRRGLSLFFLCARMYKTNGRPATVAPGAVVTFSQLRRTSPAQGRRSSVPPSAPPSLPAAAQTTGRGTVKPS